MDATVAPVSVDVCVCTFRRRSLMATLESLARQKLEERVSLRVIVADNDDTPSAQDLASRAREGFGINLHYLHAPARNISVARNACLDAASADYVAFIDDDGVATRDWLAALLASMRASGADVVFGPVKAVYGPDAPDWMVKGDFHSIRPVVRANGEIDTGYTSNVLLRRAVSEGVRFDPSLGRSGGEDTLFFASLHARGARLAYCASAVVSEPVPAARANFSWRLKRSLRTGQTYYRVLRARRRNPIVFVPLAAAKVLYCAAAALLALPSPVAWRRSVFRAALHAGIVMKAFGAGDPVLYGA